MTETKLCPSCRQVKPLEQFSWKNKGKNKRAVYCKPCFKERMRVDYQNKSGRYQENRRQRHQEITKWYQEYKRLLVCGCGENHPACLEFHHKDPTTKVMAVADTLRMGWSVERIMQEIAKCDVLCANCHRKAHYVSPR